MLATNRKRAQKKVDLVFIFKLLINLSATNLYNLLDKTTLSSHFNKIFTHTKYIFNG